MKIEFQITENEYGEAVRAMNRGLQDWYRPLSVGGIIASGVGMAFLFGADGSNWIAPAILGLFGLFVPIYPWFVVGRRMNAGWLRYSVTGVVTWEFDDDGISFRSELAVSRWQWLAFDQCVETRNLFLLSRGHGLPQLIPKRAFQDKTQLEEFRRYAREKLSPPTGRFPVKPL